MERIALWQAKQRHACWSGGFDECFAELAVRSRAPRIQRKREYIEQYAKCSVRSCQQCAPPQQHRIAKDCTISLVGYVIPGRAVVLDSRMLGLLVYSNVNVVLLYQRECCQGLLTETYRLGLDSCAPDSHGMCIWAKLAAQAVEFQCIFPELCIAQKRLSRPRQPS